MDNKKIEKYEGQDIVWVDLDLGTPLNLKIFGTLIRREGNRWVVRTHFGVMEVGEGQIINRQTLEEFIIEYGLYVIVKEGVALIRSSKLGVEDIYPYTGDNKHYEMFAYNYCLVPPVMDGE